MRQLIFLIIVIGLGVGLSVAISRLRSAGQPLASNTANSSASESNAEETAKDKTQYPKYREIVQPSGFVNTDKITLGELVGKKVILLDFMTYSCINCVRTFPYLAEWYQKYKDDGLEIVAIHTPEFAFEKKRDNVIEAMKKYNLKFPVVMDNDYATWNAYGNRYWPRKYLIDIDGYIVYDHIGEGAYDVTERKIQVLLRERGKRLGTAAEIKTDMTKPEAVEEVNRFAVRSPETYFGTLRQSYSDYTLAPDGQITKFSEPDTIRPNQLYLVGEWKITGEYAEAASVGAKIIFKYSAQKVFLVASADETARAAITLDGAPVGERSGRDLKENAVEFRNEDLYRLIEDSAGGEHTLEIIMEKPGVRVFAFTFG